MSWNNRVVSTVLGNDSYYSLHQVYYHDDGSIRAYTDSLHGFFNSIEEMKEYLQFQLQDIERRDVLSVEDLDGATECHPKRNID